MIWESEGGAKVKELPLSPHLDEVELDRLERLRAEARDDETDDFEEFDEEDFDDDFDDDFEEEHDEEYEAENEEYPDDDFGTGADLDEDLGGIEIEGDIEGDFDEGLPAVEPDAEPGEGEEEVPEGEE